MVGARGKAIGILTALFVALPVAAGELTIEDRIRHQRAVEQVTWSHRVWPAENTSPKPALAEVMSDAAIRAKVDTYLKKSAALEKIWRRAITHDQLQAEIDRLVRETKDGATLTEIFAALGNDPAVIAECFARPLLADRLVRDWYAHDDRFHGALRLRAQAARDACSDASCMKAMGSAYAERRYERETTSDRLRADHIVRLEPADLSALRAMFTAPVGRAGDVEETWDSFTVRAVIAEGTDGFTAAAVTWPKEEFNTWWQDRSATLTADVAVPGGSYTIQQVPLAGCTPNTWSPTYLGAADARSGHTAVWTGTEMIVWGGGVPVGGRYNPSTNTWIQVTAGAGSPSPRTGSTAVWTGTEMIVWGGRTADSAQTSLADGARYDPSNDAWTALPSTDAPNARHGHAAVWTGSLMVVWGGTGGGVGGGRYSPASNTWSATAITGAPAARAGHTVVWTGSEAIFWGGDNAGTKVNTGGRYNPAADSWVTTNTIGAPQARGGHTAIWTGTEMIVWGGDTGLAVLNSGGRYNPTTDSWLVTPTAPPAPVARTGHTAVWSGARMIVWGGTGSTGLLSSGASYDPPTNGWATTAGGASNPAPRQFHTAVWSGSEMLVWGGLGASVFNNGGRYSLASNSWVPISTGNFVPAARAEHSAVWSGSEMIVWGGQAGPYTNTGGRYDLTTNTWTPTSVGINVPAPRANHTAVWTGLRMVVWGGYNGSQTLDTGGRYDPFTDSWTTTSLTAVPFRRWYHTAVWTGSVMIVWGGGDESLNPFNTGGRYDPIANTWVATATTGAPTGREAHAAVWVGDSMIVWGGADATLFGTNTGGLYILGSNSWAPIFAGPNAPSPRFWPAYAYENGELLIWGGGGTTDVTGGRYFPPTGQWSAISTVGAPSARELMGFVWAGDKLVVWGGRYNFPPPIPALGTGGRFTPATNTWTSTPVTGSVPSARCAHTAIWTGSVMVVWGGLPVTQAGGIFCPDECVSPATYYLDADGDGYGTSLQAVQACSPPAGYSTNSTDCNDGNPNINPGAFDQCNVEDRSCDGITDSQIPPEINIGTVVKTGYNVAHYPWSSFPGARYDAYRGVYAGAIGSDPFNEYCLRNNYPTTGWTDDGIPDAGKLWWILPRAVNGCGDGTLGFATDHTTPTTERISLQCP